MFYDSKIAKLLYVKLVKGLFKNNWHLKTIVKNVIIINKCALVKIINGILFLKRNVILQQRNMTTIPK